MLVLTAVVSAAVLLRGLLVPPLAWDSLTYQLVKPAVWVQTAEMITQLAPDAWSYYAYFPYTGNIFWAWAMLPVHGELLLAPTGFAVWLSILLAAYTAARLLGAERVTSMLAALTIGMTPAVFAYVISGYVDNTLLAAFLLGMVFLIRTLTGHRREAVLVAAGFGLAAGVKLTGAIMLCLAGPALAVYLLRRRVGLKQWLATMAIASAAAVVGIMPYLRTWAETGSPLYPQGLRLFGSDVFVGNQQLADVLSGEVFQSAPRSSELNFLWATLVPRWQFAGLGPVAPVWIGVGVFGLVLLLRRSALRAPVAFMLVGAAASAAMLYGPGTGGMRAYWPCTCARFWMPAFACCVLWATAALASCQWHRASKWLWLAAIGFGLVMGLPRDWSAADAKAVGSGAVWLAVPFAAAWFCWAFVRRLHRPRLAAALGLLVAGTAVLPLMAVRDQHRYAIYQAAGAHPVLGHPPAGSRLRVKLAHLAALRCPARAPHRRDGGLGAGGTQLVSLSAVGKPAAKSSALRADHERRPDHRLPEAPATRPPRRFQRLAGSLDRSTRRVRGGPCPGPYHRVAMDGAASGAVRADGPLGGRTEPGVSLPPRRGRTSFRRALTQDRRSEVNRR